MKIGYLVNTEAEMSQEMMEALTRFEFQCVFTSVKVTTPETVREFLASEYTQELADSFQPEFMVSAPNP